MILAFRALTKKKMKIQMILSCRCIESLEFAYTHLILVHSHVR